MMKKGRDLVNLPVIDLSSGRLVGKVKEILIGDQYFIKGFVVITDKNTRHNVAIQEVQSIGRDAVLLHSWREHSPESAFLEEPSRDYSGSLVLTSTGRSLGTIQDVVLQEDGHVVAGFEVSDGYLKDLLMGRTVVAAEDVLTYGNGAVIVNDLEQGDEK
jgi:uncharacterized protein YrrD